MDLIAAIAKKIMPSVRIWSYHYSGAKGKKSAPKGVQSLKNKFVELTQFAHDPLQRRLQWKIDMETASNDAVNETCPNWETEKKDLMIYRLIQETKDRALITNRRQEWLWQKACTWLGSLARETENPEFNPDYQIYVGREEFSPRQAISIAYYIFLRGAGKIESFVRYLEKRNNKSINGFIKAHKGSLLDEW